VRFVLQGGIRLEIALAEFRGADTEVARQRQGLERIDSNSIAVTAAAAGAALIAEDGSRLNNPG
jgi:hypothetical protein